MEKICRKKYYTTNSSFNSNQSTNSINSNNPSPSASKEKFANFAVVNFIDYFNEIGGFKIIFNILLEPNDSIIPSPNNTNFNPSSNQNVNAIAGKQFYLGFDLLQYFLEFLDNLNTYVNLREIFCKEINSLKENILLRISNLSEIEIKEYEKNIIEKIGRHIKSIIDPEDKTLLYDEINLNFHLKCFTSKNLPKRIKGITEINNLIQKVESKGNHQIVLNE